MTEQEIIKYLKENKTRGVAFVFMPKEVKEWACDNSRLIIYYNKFGWDDYNKFGWNDSPSDIEKYRPTDVIALPHDYEPRREQQGGWVEFEINKIGRFTDYDVDDDGHQISFSFGWHQLSEFLECSYEHGFGYTAFGGWQYADSNIWFTTPQLKIILADLITYEDSFSPRHYASPAACDCKPAIPIKIRFWKESR